MSDGSQKKLFSLLKTMVILAHRDGRNLMTEDPKLMAEVVSLLSDMQISVGAELR